MEYIIFLKSGDKLVAKGIGSSLEEAVDDFNSSFEDVIIDDIIELLEEAKG